MQNNATNIAPPIKLKERVRELNINAMPRYIGFLESLNIPTVTSEVACSGFSGLIVVLLTLNALAAEIKTNNPIVKNMKLRIDACSNSIIGNKRLEKYIANPNTKVTNGGGILVCILLSSSHSQAYFFALNFHNIAAHKTLRNKNYLAFLQWGVIVIIFHTSPNLFVI